MRLEEDLIKEVDEYVDYFTIKNRSQAIKFLLKTALDEKKVAVILAKGRDVAGADLEKDLKINDDEYNITAKIKNTTLIEEQLKYLRKYNFNTIYIVYPKKIIQNIQEIIGNQPKADIKFFEIKNKDMTADALKILKGKIHSNFLMIYGDVISNMNLENIYIQHVKSNSACTMMVTSSKMPSEKGSVKIEGNKIIGFEEKTKVQENFIVSEPIYIMGPEIFDIKGKSLPYDIFPELAKKNILGAHLSSSDIVHLHEEKDKKNIVEFLNNNT